MPVRFSAVFTGTSWPRARLRHGGHLVAAFTVAVVCPTVPTAHL
jgi:hypothetical protein